MVQKDLQKICYDLGKLFIAILTRQTIIYAVFSERE